MNDKELFWEELMETVSSAYDMLVNSEYSDGSYEPATVLEALNTAYGICVDMVDKSKGE